jgi:hypothetical protein
VLLLVVLLLQMQLLEKLKLLQDGQHIVLREAGEIQGGQLTVLQVQLLLQGVVLITPRNLNFAVFNGLKFGDDFRD